jgi:hypothetical protein
MDQIYHTFGFVLTMDISPQLTPSLPAKCTMNSIILLQQGTGRDGITVCIAMGVAIYSKQSPAMQQGLQDILEVSHLVPFLPA